MDTKGVDCSKRKRPPQRDTNKAFRLPSRACAPARRKRTATVSIFVSAQMFCGPACLGQKAALYASVWETNCRPFGARCGDDPIWIVLGNQHPCKYLFNLFKKFLTWKIVLQDDGMENFSHLVSLLLIKWYNSDVKYVHLLHILIKRRV
ncbi:hypothetical protein TS65_28735 [Aneurinibacillus migulanus]|uniref:Uncharacterized protein n=1 Tax=Aneurinibacillus migulanus TaxID=47500 RepID=A0A0D1X8Q0_ANEMI|nr:hypothetical protein TS65_28735 [Aneurinibacillus migulanus]KON97082.1 hypothetical protein AF333_18010 [Aneurinibacillus migulanus]